MGVGSGERKEAGEGAQARKSAQEDEEGRYAHSY